MLTEGGDVARDLDDDGLVQRLCSHVIATLHVSTDSHGSHMSPLQCLANIAVLINELTKGTRTGI